MNESLVTVTNLRKEFRVRGSRHDTVVALDDVSFDLPRGGALAVVGESGSGKSTTARIVAGLEVATAGSVELAGAAGGEGGRRGRGRRSRSARARSVQMVFQDPMGSLDPRQRIGAGIAELLDAHFPMDRTERDERVQRLLTEVGLDERHAGALPRALSGGQRQRAAIARALVLEPELLILDEAVSALDVSVQAQVLNLLADIRERTQIAYLFVSHDLAVVRQVTDDCLVMREGRVVERGATETVLDHPQAQYTRELLDAVPRPGWRPRRRAALSGS